MKYIVLLRGINVGGKNRVEMSRLKLMLESLAYTDVSTYLNSGNAFFCTNNNKDKVQDVVTKAFEKNFVFTVPILIKTYEEIKSIANAIPKEWQNDKEYKTDIAYLFPEIDSEEIIDNFPANKEYIELIYTKGAIIWRVKKDDYNKSQLSKIAGKKIYKMMTVRNVNTARRLAR